MGQENSKMEKIMDVIFENPEASLKIRDISKNAKIPRSTVHRYLHILKRSNITDNNNKPIINNYTKFLKSVHIIKRIYTSGLIGYLEEKLGKVWASKRTIMSPDKTMVYGDFLIDDKPQKGKLEPDWEQLLFDQPYNKSVKGLRRITWRNYKEVLGLK